MQNQTSKPLLDQWASQKELWNNHAHVYDDAEHRNEAATLHSDLQTRCQSLSEQVTIYPLVDRLVGPHLMPMI